MESDNPSDNMLISNSTSMTSASNRTDKYTQRLNNVFKVSLVVNIFLLCTLIFLFIFKTFGKNDDDDAKADYVNIKMPDSGVCFPCDYLGPDVKREDTLYDHIQTTDNGQKLCCITSLPDITTLMRKVIKYAKRGREIYRVVCKTILMPRTVFDPDDNDILSYFIER